MGRVRWRVGPVQMFCNTPAFRPASVGKTAGTARSWLAVMSQALGIALLHACLAEGYMSRLLNFPPLLLSPPVLRLLRFILQLLVVRHTCSAAQRRFQQLFAGRHHGQALERACAAGLGCLGAQTTRQVVQRGRTAAYVRVIFCQGAINIWPVCMLWRRCCRVGCWRCCCRHTGQPFCCRGAASHSQLWSGVQDVDGPRGCAQPKKAAEQAAVRRCSCQGHGGQRHADFRVSQA